MLVEKLTCYITHAIKVVIDVNLFEWRKQQVISNKNRLQVRCLEMLINCVCGVDRRFRVYVVVVGDR